MLRAPHRFVNTTTLIALSAAFAAGYYSGKFLRDDDEEESETEGDQQGKVMLKVDEEGAGNKIASPVDGAENAIKREWRAEHPESLYGGRHVKELEFPSDTSTRTVFEVNLAAISHNARALQERAAAKGCEVMGVVKANAYGHGAVAVSHMLQKCNDIRIFAVATVTEAIELRLSGLTPEECRILVLGASHRSEWPVYQRFSLEMMVESRAMAEELVEWARNAWEAQKEQGKAPEDPIRVHVMLNTGMSRLGLETFMFENRNEDDDDEDVSSLPRGGFADEVSPLGCSSLGSSSSKQEATSVVNGRENIAPPTTTSATSSSSSPFVSPDPSFDHARKDGSLRARLNTRAGAVGALDAVMANKRGAVGIPVQVAVSQSPSSSEGIPEPHPGKCISSPMRRVSNLSLAPTTAEKEDPAAFVPDNPKGGENATASVGESSNKHQRASAAACMTSSTFAPFQEATATATLPIATAGELAKRAKEFGLRRQANQIEAIGRCRTGVYHGVEVATAADVIYFLATASVRRGVGGRDGEALRDGGLEHNRRTAVQFEGVCTHMCDARAGSTYSQRQFRRVAAVVSKARARGVFVPSVHFENSECLLQGLIPDEAVRDLLEAGDANKKNGYGRTRGYCRTGGALYGQRSHECLRPCVTLKAQVRHVHIVKAGVSVGYERSWVADQDCTIATLAIGFADGLERDLSNAVESDRGPAYGKGGCVFIHGRRCPIVGKVCMDMVMVECGPPPNNIGARQGGERGVHHHGSERKEENGDDGDDCDKAGIVIRPGDYAICFGVGGPSLKETAALLGTALSDITVSITRRVYRNYVNAPEPKS